MKRRLIGIAAAGLTMVMALSGCGGGGSGGGDGKTIKFIAAKYSEKTQPYWQNLIKEFEAENPGYQVNLEVVDWEQIDQKVKTLVQTRQEPDILNLNKFSDFARDGMLYSVDEAVSPQVKNDFLANFVEVGKYRGTQYGLPFISSARLFFYNKEIFAKAGLSAPPESWDEVKRYAQQIKAKVAGVYPLGLPLGAEESQAEFFMWAMNNGGGWVDASGEWAVNSPRNVETLTFLRDLTKSGLTQPNPETTNRKDVFNLFAQGKIGMLNGAVFMPTSFINPVNPNLRYGVAPLPSKDGATHNTLGVVDFLMAFKKDDGANKEAVSKFLDFCYAKENVAKFLEDEGFLPVTRSAGEALNSDAYLKQFIDQLPNAKFAPTDDPAWQAVDGAAKQRLGTAVANTDPKAVLDQIQQTAEQNSE
ncbi:extracellular solute-binding protein [Carbonactinospora thermoautotrophica]|nr:extracellular solute-binding protein [Carbonactinospora thermoautotrophica]